MLEVVAFYHVGGKTHNVAFQLDLRQLLQNKLHVFAARFTEAFVWRTFADKIN